MDRLLALRGVLKGTSCLDSAAEVAWEEYRIPLLHVILAVRSGAANPARC